MAENIISSKKYRDDTLFQKINKKYLTLEEEDRKMNNAHMKGVIEQSLLSFLRKDDLFNLLFRRIMYGGSFYKGTRYGKPDEFDLDFVLKLPIDYNFIKIEPNTKDYGFVKIKIDPKAFKSQDWIKHSTQLSKWITSDNYLNQDNFRRWIESVLSKVFNKFMTPDGSPMEYNGQSYRVRLRKSGPAFTFLITTPEGSTIDIDVVPCLEFDKILGHGYKPLNGPRKTFMVVAKPLANTIPNHDILWRLCFYEHEKEFLSKGGQIKPVIKLMKKFRNKENMKLIASYHIETLFYHQLEKNGSSNLLRSPMTEVLMIALHELQKALETQKLNYFWHHEHNLFGKIDPIVSLNWACRLKNLLKEIDNKISSNRFILVEILLPANEAKYIKGDQFEELEATPVPQPGPDAAQPQSWCTIV